MIATSAAIAPLPAMPMSILLVLKYIVATAASTPAAAARFVTIAISGKRPSSALRPEPGLNPNQPSHRISTPRPNSGIECPGIARGRPVAVVLAAARAEQQQRGERAGGADQVDHGRAGEVLHADEVASQPPPKIQCAPIG